MNTKQKQLGEELGQVVEPPYNMNWKVVKIVAVSALVLLSAMQVFAFTKDTVLESLDAGLASNIAAYEKNMAAANLYIESANSSSEAVCASWKANKAYKESKGIELKEPTFNPCQTMRGFQPTETTPIQPQLLKQTEEATPSNNLTLPLQVTTQK